MMHPMSLLPPPNESALSSAAHPTDSILNHLRELRNRLIISILAWLMCSGVSYWFIQPILAFLTAPLAEAFPHAEHRRLIFTGLPEAFVTYITLSLFVGFMVAFPIIVMQLYRFIAPGLYRTERRAVIPFLAAAPLLFYAGAALAYFYIFPLAWKFFVGFELLPINAGAGLPIELETRLSEYLALVTSMVLSFGIAFQLPLALVLLIRAGLISTAQLTKGRRYAIVILLTIAAVLTPPDVFSQIGLFIPLYTLYELAIIAGRRVEKRRDG
jgi:sec-independent protein translocase protein TatC